MSAKPGDKAPVWRGTFGQRVMDARMLLSIHGFLSDAETRAANRRIAKWAASHGYEVTRDPLTRASKTTDPIRRATPPAETAPKGKP